MAKLVSFDYLGEHPVYDITVDEHHNFIANGVVIHNCMRVAQELAGFSPGDSYRFVKVIAKKLPDKMAAMKAKFITGAQPRIDAGECTLHDVEVIWGLLETFAGYGFNKSVDITTPVMYSDGQIGEIGAVASGDSVLCYDGNGYVPTEVVVNHNHGFLPAFECEFDGGRKVVCSILHKFETESGKVPLWKLLMTGEGVLCAKAREEMGMSDLPRRVQNGETPDSSSEGIRTQYEGFAEEVGLCGMRIGSERDTQLAKSSGEVPRCHFDSKCESCGGKQEGGCKSEGGARFSRGKAEVDRDGSQGVGDEICSCREVQESCGSKQDSGISGEGVSHCKKNVGPQGHSEVEGIGPEEVEGRQSRRIQKKHVKGAKGSQEVSGRGRIGEDSVSTRIQKGLSNPACRQAVETGGFHKEQLLDRSGRMLAFRIKGVKTIHEEGGGGSRAGFGPDCGGRAETRNPSANWPSVLDGEPEKQKIKATMASMPTAPSKKSCSGGVSVRKLLHARFVGFRPMCDLEVRHPSHNFVLANGLITSNSHATAYSAVSTVELWLKFNYFSEFMCALINNTDPGKKKHGSSNIMVNYINYTRRKGVKVLGPHISKSRRQFTIEDAGIRFSMGHIKFVASQAEVIEEFQPIESIEDFHERVKATTIGKKGKKSSRRPNIRQVKSLIAAGAFDHLGTRNEVMAEYYRVRKKKSDGEPPQYDEDKWVELEQEAIGLCLSQEPLYVEYKEDIKENKWTAIHAVGDEKKVKVFGKVQSITPHTSKAGNTMFIVTMGDGLDSLKFFVFRSAMDFFRQNVRVGMMGGFPLDRFEDSDTRFYNDRGELDIMDTE